VAGALLATAAAGLAGAAVISAPNPEAARSNLLRIGVVTQQGDRGFRIQAASMEPTLHCARPGRGCEAGTGDYVLVRPYATAEHPGRGDLVVFTTPPAAERQCGSGGIFVKRVIGLQGETWSERQGFVYIDGKKLGEAYVPADRRDSESHAPVTVQRAHVFLMGDNRVGSCDSRRWGTVARGALIGKAIAIYWPTGRAWRL
jgi:signal peptidase I